MSALLNIIKVKIVHSKLIVFIILSIIWTLIPEKLPVSAYNYKLWLYKERKWEHGGEIYEKLFLVKRWKSRLPDIGDFFKWRFSKRHFKNININYIQTFLIESCKAEFAHWMIILSSFLFLFWGGPSMFFKFFMLSVVLNLPYIIIQRYNRPRLVKLLKKNTVTHYELAPVKA